MARMIHRVHSVAFHRNGVAGEGFYAVSFSTREMIPGTRQRWALIAAVFEARGRVAVLSPGCVLECWRGDNFEPELRSAIAAWEAARAA